MAADHTYIACCQYNCTYLVKENVKHSFAMATTNGSTLISLANYIYIFLSKSIQIHIRSLNTSSVINFGLIQLPCTHSMQIETLYITAPYRPMSSRLIIKIFQIFTSCLHFAHSTFKRYNIIEQLHRPIIKSTQMTNWQHVKSYSMYHFSSCYANKMPPTVWLARTIAPATHTRSTNNRMHTQCM